LFRFRAILDDSQVDGIAIECRQFREAHGVSELERLEEAVPSRGTRALSKGGKAFLCVFKQAKKYRDISGKFHKSDTLPGMLFLYPRD